VSAAVGLERSEVVARLARADPRLARRLVGLEVDPVAAGQVIAATGTVTTALVALGRLRYAEQLWWQTLDWVLQALRGEAPSASGRPFDRYTDVLGTVVAATGSEHFGIAASPGRSVGRATYLADPGEGDRLRPGDILVVDEPLPAFGQLLWTASAVVSRVGSPGAHLCEVARSLHVPAVVAVDLGPEPPASHRQIPRATSAIAVDGDQGVAWWAVL
jgi:hypothetical protein